MTFAEHLSRERSITNARRAYVRERRWRGDEWYVAWQTTDLPDEVTRAIDGRSR